MDESEKSQKGFLSGVWKVFTSTPAQVFYGLVLGLALMPLVADMGTWYTVFHNSGNLRALAFQQTMEPYTGWLPYHIGLTEPGGLLYGIMDWFIEDELDTLIAEASAAEVADGTQNSGSYLQESNADLGDDVECEYLGTCAPT